MASVDALTANITVGFQATVSDTVDLSTLKTLPININAVYTAALGTSDTLVAGTNNIGATGIGCDQAFVKDLALAGSAQTLDLQSVSSAAGGAVVDVVLTKLKAIAIFNRATTAGYVLQVGAAASNAFTAIFSDATDELVIGPQGMALIVYPAGYTVDATHKDLKFDPGANTFNVTVVAIGVD